MITVTVSDLTTKVNEGWKKDALATHYGLPVTQMTQLLKDAGLRIRKFHKPKYELVDDTVVAPVEIHGGTAESVGPASVSGETTLLQTMFEEQVMPDEETISSEDVAEQDVEVEEISALDTLSQESTSERESPVDELEQGEIADAGIAAEASVSESLTSPEQW